MAENTPATDAGTPAPHPNHRRRKPIHTKETTTTRTSCPTSKTRSKIDVAIQEAAARLAANAPPLSEGQKRRIAELFAPAIDAVKR